MNVKITIAHRYSSSTLPLFLSLSVIKQIRLRVTELSPLLATFCILCYHPSKIQFMNFAFEVTITPYQFHPAPFREILYIVFCISCIKQRLLIIVRQLCKMLLICTIMLNCCCILLSGMLINFQRLS